MNGVQHKRLFKVMFSFSRQTSILCISSINVLTIILQYKYVLHVFVSGAVITLLQVKTISWVRVLPYVVCMLQRQMVNFVCMFSVNPTKTIKRL